MAIFMLEKILNDNLQVLKKTQVQNSIIIELALAMILLFALYAEPVCCLFHFSLQTRMQIIFQLCNGFFLRENSFFHHIINGEYAHHMIAFKYGEVADMFVA